jgi:RNA polymerase subunit RPABC4/transcription elongation factor Spt4
MANCEVCDKYIPYGDMCPLCKSKERATNMAVGDKGG